MILMFEKVRRIIVTICQPSLSSTERITYLENITIASFSKRQYSKNSVNFKDQL